MPKYKLMRRFYDGEVLHPVDTILEFKEGGQPSSAKLVTAKKKEAAEEFVEVDESFTKAGDLFVKTEEPLLAKPTLGVEDAKLGDTLSSLSKRK